LVFIIENEEMDSMKEVYDGINYDYGEDSGAYEGYSGDKR
jgi:hypothetical protein